MNITIEYKKQKALELMKTLDIYKPYIKGFEKDNNVCFFEGYGGFWAYQEPELLAKIKEFEEKHNVLVYAVTHEYLEFGECYDFLFIPDYTFSNTYGFTNSIRKSNILLNSAYTALLCQHRFYGFAVRIKSSANGLRRTD